MNLKKPLWPMSYKETFWSKGQNNPINKPIERFNQHQNLVHTDFRHVFTMSDNTAKIFYDT